MTTTTKGEDTRERILQRSVELAARVGFEGLSLGQLASEVDMSKSGLFAHFTSKEDLQIQSLRTARESYVEHVFVPAIRKPRGEQRLREIFQRWMEWERGVTAGGCPFVVAAAEYDDRQGPVRDEIVAILGELIDALDKAAALAVEVGDFRSDLDTRQFAFEMHGIVLAYHQAFRLFRDENAGRRAHTAFEALLERSHDRDSD